jgi:dimethylargininase
MHIALTRPPSPRLGECELTHLPRTPINADLVCAQHRGYCVALGRLGCDVYELPATPDLPDGVFVEDRAIVLDEVAIITRSAAVSRRNETLTVEAALRQHRAIEHITTPATLDGGDVLRLGRTLFVGVTPRTNTEAVTQLREHLAPQGYSVCAVPVHGSLHLKSGCSVLGPDLLVINRDWVDTDAILATATAVRFVDVDPREPRGGNHLLLGDTVLSPASCPRTVGRIRELGVTVETVDVSELEKAEAGVTCSSLVFSAGR